MDKISPERIRRIRIWSPGKEPTQITPYDESGNGVPLIDLASNDYLAISRHPDLIQAARNSLLKDGVGAGSSRLITGSRAIHKELEEELGEWIGKERIFLFPSGFQANLAAVLALANRNTIIIADRMIHHSLLLGVKASGGKLYRYLHNDMSDLEKILKKCKTTKSNNDLLVISESLFSMEGTSPDLPTIAQLSKKYGARVLIDEAHALGTMGPQGKGLAHNISEQISIITGTFGKAFGSGGAFLGCDNYLGEHLLQNSGAFRYTTALAPSLAAASLTALNLIKQHPEWVEELQKEAERWRGQIHKNGLAKPPGTGPILSLILGSDKRALDAEKSLEWAGMASIAIRPPTVPEGSSRIRIVLRRGLPQGTLNKLIDTLNQKK